MWRAQVINACIFETFASFAFTAVQKKISFRSEKYTDEPIVNTMPFSVVSVEAIIQKMHVIRTLTSKENKQNMKFPEGHRSVY